VLDQAPARDSSLLDRAAVLDEPGAADFPQTGSPEGPSPEEIQEPVLLQLDRVVTGLITVVPLALVGLAAWQLQRARDFINVNLAHDLSIAEIAHECGLSSGYFARAFKRSTGVPPYLWLTKMRVERAKELLKDPCCELADIALLCGFVDQSHFTRVFSRSEGYSPGRWRRLQRL